MPDEPIGYESNLSGFGGHPLNAVRGLKASQARALAQHGYRDAEQVVAAAAVPEARGFLAQELGVSESDLDALTKQLQDVVPPQVRATLQTPTAAHRALGALAPTPEIESEIQSAATQIPPELALAIALPTSVNHAKEMPPIRNQGNRGTCVAFTLTAVHEFYQRVSGTSIDYSEQFLYHRTKLIDGYPNTCGTWQVKAAQVLSNLGQCRDTVWSYNPQPPCNNNGVEPANALTDAAGNKLTTMILAPKDVNAIKSALAGGSVVGFSVPVYNSWFQSSETARTGRITMRLGAEPSVGGHAMCLIGYQDDAASPGGGFFILRNSWGTVNWGYECPYDAGNGTIPYQYIASECWEAMTTAPPRRRIVVPDDRWRWRRRWPFVFGEEEGMEPGEARERTTLMIETGGRFDILIR